MKIDLMTARGFKKPAPARSAPSVAAEPRNAASFTIESSSSVAAASDPGSGLPLWTFTVRSSRDGTTYPGTMVGRNQVREPAPTNIHTELVP